MSSASESSLVLVLILKEPRSQTPFGNALAGEIPFRVEGVPTGGNEWQPDICGAESELNQLVPQPNPTWRSGGDGNPARRHPSTRNGISPAMAFPNGVWERGGDSLNYSFPSCTWERTIPRSCASAACPGARSGSWLVHPQTPPHAKQSFAPLGIPKLSLGTRALTRASCCARKSL